MFRTKNCRSYGQLAMTAVKGVSVLLCLQSNSVLHSKTFFFLNHYDYLVLNSLTLHYVANMQRWNNLDISMCVV